MLANGIQQVASGASGNLTLALKGLFGTFAAKYSIGTDGDPFPYAIVRDSDGVGIEWGIGHLSASTTLVRDKIIETWSGTAFNNLAPTATDLTSGGPYTVMVADNSSVRPIAPIGSDTSVSGTRYLMPAQWCGNAAANVGLVAGTAQIVPFRLDIPATCSGIAIKVTTVAATGTTKNMRAALYRCDKNGHMGNLIAETIALSAGTGAVVKALTFPASVRLDPGWYYIAMLADGNPNVAGTNATGGAGICPMWGTPGGDPAGRYIVATKSITYVDSGACFPAAFGTTGITYSADWAASAPCANLMVTS